MKTKLSIFCEKIIEAGWLAAVVAVPLFFNIYSARTFEPDKITLLRSIVSIMILAWIILVVEQGAGSSNGKSTSFSDRFRGWLKIPLFWPTLFLVVIYIVSTIFSISPNVSLWGSYQRLQGTYSMLSYIVVFALMAGHLRSREQIDRLVMVMIVTSIPVSLYGIIQRYGLDPLPWAGDVTRRVASNMGNAIFVASYLIMIIPLTITRLIESMTAIIKEQNASWGHTILSSVYIFALAVQILTVLFSQSRGPMLGLLGAAFVMGVLITLLLRQSYSDQSRLSLQEIGAGFLFVIPLGVAGALGAGLGYFLGNGLQGLMAGMTYQVEGVSVMSAALGALLGFLGVYTYWAASGKGWRWLWVSWVGVGLIAVGFVLALNIRGTGMDPYLDPVRELPYISRLAQVTETSRTGRVRVLIWDAAMELVGLHDPLGVSGDEVAPRDRFNFLRPLIGYGPESMFNAFAYVYPPELAHVELRGSSADRSHNETMDSLVITGILGFAAFYAVVVSLLYYTVCWLGWAWSQAAKRRLIVFLLAGGAIGAIVPYLAEGDFTFMPIGLPFGIFTGLLMYLCWQGVVGQRKPDDGHEFSMTHKLLLIGALGAIIGHFIEVHFVFSIAATYTYFWAYAGLMLAISRMEANAAAAESGAVPAQEAGEEQAVAEPVSKAKRSKKSRGRRGKRGSTPSQPATPGAVYRAKPEGWETWTGSQGLAMAIILIILTFNFVTPQFEFSLSNENSASLFWMLTITWLIGFAIAISTLAIRQDEWRNRVHLGRAVMLYAVTSLSYFFFYLIAHRIQFGRRITVTSIQDVISASSVLANGLVVFYIFLFLLMVIIAVTLMRGQGRGLSAWRGENWWLYPPLALAILTVIWFKNVDVVRADIYLKEGERYRNNGQWNEAIALHERALSLDSDEDFYYLMLALDYQLMAQDNSLDPAQRENAWRQGEQIALQAREINPYNPDNTGNMGRYYFTLGQVFNPQRFQDALDYFEKATVLAPSNVIYHNLWAQTHYILQNYDEAVDRLQTSVSIDPNYSPSWLLLGDTYAARGNIDQALTAHSEALKLNSRGSGDGFSSFADQFYDQRLNFYISAGRADDIIAELEDVALDRADAVSSAASDEAREAAQQEYARVQWAIGHAYNLMGEPEEAIAYLQQARELGDNSDRTLRELANIYLAQNDFEQALPVYQQLLEKNPNNVESHSALAFIYAQQGLVDEAIQHNQFVLQQLPDDYDSLKNLAILYQQKGELQQAIEAAQQAQAAAPDAEQASWEQFIADLESRLAESG